jgi:nucleoside-diphosphate-sugar epimerase
LARTCLHRLSVQFLSCSDDIESDWNPITWEEAQTAKQHITAYRASKKFAEKAAWDFIDKEKPDFDIITIQPPMVFGPCKHDVSLDSLNESNAQIWRIVSGGKNAIVPATVMWEWVDVRDAAAAHIAAIAPEVKGNQRFLLGAGEFTWQKVQYCLNKELG